MAGRHKAVVASKTGTNDAIMKKWASLTWEDVDRWAGSRSATRGRTYQRRGRVRNMAVTEDGKLLATVMGTDRYTTSVWPTHARGHSHKLESKCTCPVGFNGCKHAVAVALAYLEALAEKKEVPAARPDDPRCTKLSAEATDNNDEFGEEIEEEWDDEPAQESECEIDDDFAGESDGAEEAGDRPGRGGPVLVRAKTADLKGTARKDVGCRTRAEWEERIRSHIRQKSQDELAELVCTLVGRFPELRTEFQEHIALAEGDVGRLVNQARRELDALAAEVGWRNHWNDEGHTPDYAQLKRRLERLVEAGHHDEVAKLGEELIRRGIAQIEQSNDDGETAMEISGCLPVVFNALAKSSRQTPDKILYAIEADLQDEYDVIGDAADAILNAKWTRADWSIVADRLAERLKSTPRGKTADDFTRNYKRDCLSNWLLHSLGRAGRNDELLPVYEAEARTTGSYPRLVEYLLGEGRLEDAERWAREGIEKTQVKWPGITSALLEKLCEMARRRKDWGVVAAHAARDFFEHPSVRGFRDLVASAEKAKCGERVRAAALAYLESGRSPIQMSPERDGQRKVTVDPAWPLPVPDYLAPVSESSAAARSVRVRQNSPRPHYDVLLEMAIAEKKPDEVLHWYDEMRGSERGSASGGWGAYGYHSYAERVAAAVATAHPERALDIYRRALDTNLRAAHVSAYENCAAYLRKMRPILKLSGRPEEWTKLLADIRQNYRNRPRFMEILGTLEGRTILQTQRAQRGRRDRGGTPREPVRGDVSPNARGQGPRLQSP